ncbi:MAG: nicotinate-nucleotide--dimethylbenzimidazole phosphoribosyltransferase [Actinomycetota bacterium]|nr:nicotinate-nucleotide--dimethylbenzimidazole phosphoribosyltransferase [Actinomycetota bacterium]
MVEPDHAARRAVAERAAQVLRPAGALRRLDEIAAWLAGWQRTDRPAVERPAAVVFAADHGVAAEGVSAYPAAVTGEMLRALRAGVATAAVLCRQVGAALHVVDVGVGRPTGNITVEPALDSDGFAAAWAAGRDAVATLDADLLVLGEMGIANTTTAAAVAAGLFGGPVSDWVGRGTGVDDAGLAHKTAVVERAGARVAGVTDPLEILREVGGSELVAMAGAAQAARDRSLPLLLDGYVVTAALAPLAVARPGALDHCLAAHRSPEPGHGRLLARLGLEPLLDLELRLGEGSGALLAVPIVAMAAAAVTDVATFAEWGM